MSASNARAPWIGVSLKLYFSLAETVAWCAEVKALPEVRTLVRDGRVRLSVFPAFPCLEAALSILSGAGIQVGAQNLFWDDAGPYTGEVGGRLLAEIGCVSAEIGHAERRVLLGETDQVVGRKTAAAIRNGLVPVVCVGETHLCPAPEAARHCVAQLRAATKDVTEADLVIAYEPVWAIGQSEPAAESHIRAVCSELRAAVASSWQITSADIVYGGSAKPGLLDRLGDSVDGLFLGRFAHVPHDLGTVLCEAGRSRAR